MNYSAITPVSDPWDSFVRSHARGHCLQLRAWGKLKQAFGWRYEIVETPAGGTLILYRALPFRLGAMAYVPMGPLLRAEQGDATAVWQAIHAAARKQDAAFLKWEPGIYGTGDTPPQPTQLDFRESPQTVQPPRTVLIDIAADEETILARMNQGTRRKIRQSLKNDVQYVEATREQVSRFTQMMTETGTRNAFGTHSPEYYEQAYDLFVPETAALILAEHEGDVLAGIMVFAVGKTAWYLYGASSSSKRNLMAAYGVQWKAIQWAKGRGCTHYDMWGIPDEDETTLEAQFETRSDGLWGVYGFKRGWGGEVVRSLGAWDFVYTPLIYRAYQFALRLRQSAE
jgi:lipid II:glycine glycyltransferase (peptidoglycan interpeptide bridge formation enzyme)